ncbi:MAG: 1-acyl-sn-glycerol-3-phosphate acyltransferase [Desulfobacterales bacterium]|jgi:1-acyl-sn-glycerol-3-phosphate acyltransferase|nr:1-acyl-sn-glycerol-3-phosphate acyltransferase [Desulfobacterales bacterium]MBU0734840.1 1-acyl-sn-glycerol-3-phosphate acyltransferase [Pseudomonadota bacterium]
MPVCFRYIKPVADVAITSIVWVYYIFSYLVFFSLCYFGAFLFSRNREISFQRVNHFYYRSFFFFVRTIVPGLEFRIQDEIFSIRSSVIVCNHLSYLDPILLISLFKKHKTIVKNTFFKLPIFGWVLKTAGYLPATASGALTPLMIEHMDNLQGYLSSGGNLFVFPEGTRSRNGKLGQFNEGAFKIAKRCNAPIKVLSIRNTNIFFPPGKFLFNTCIENTIELRLIGSIEPNYQSRGFSISDLKGEVWSLLNNSLNS